MTGYVVWKFSEKGKYWSYCPKGSDHQTDDNARFFFNLSRSGTIGKVSPNVYFSYIWVTKQALKYTVNVVHCSDDGSQASFRAMSRWCWAWGAGSIGTLQVMRGGCQGGNGISGKTDSTAGAGWCFPRKNPLRDTFCDFQRVFPTETQKVFLKEKSEKHIMCFSDVSHK